MARQIAYLTHTNYNPKRHAYVQAMRDQILARRRLVRPAHVASSSTGSQDEQVIVDQLDELDDLADWWPSRLAGQAGLAHHLVSESVGQDPDVLACDRVQSEGSLVHATSLQSLNLDQAGCPVASECTDSPRSLDHYQGFGANYSRNYSQMRQQQQSHRQPPEIAGFDYSDSQAYCYESGAGIQPSTPQALRPPLQQPIQQQLRFAEPEVMQPPPPPSRRVSTASSCESPQVRAHEAHQSQRPRRNQRAAARPEELAVDANPVDSVLDGGAKPPPASDQQSSASTDADKWSDSDADAIVRGARETAQMAMSMYQFTRGEGDLNTTQDLFTQAELFAEEANELYKEVRCFSYKVSEQTIEQSWMSA